MKKDNDITKGYAISRFALALVLSLSLALILSGCAGTGGGGGEAITGSGPEAGQEGAEAPPEEIKEGVIGEEGIRIPAEASISEGRTSAPFLPVYFDYDSYVIRPDMIERMEHNAKVLLDNPGIRVEIQGNCDERGTNEYNLALGEKRAKAAKDYLVTLGVDPARITTVSLGEEKPLDPGHNEEAWAKNRRDDFIIFK